MKKAFLSLAFMLVLPFVTWQTYSPATKVLTVYKGNSASSEIFFQGNPEDYKGGATQEYVAPFIPGITVLSSSTTTPEVK